MKIVLIIIGVICSIFILLFILSGPLIKNVNSCLTQYNDSSEQTLVLKKQEKWTNLKLCKEHKDVVWELLNCYWKVKKSSFIPIHVIFKIGGVINSNVLKTTDQEIVKFHNDMCFDYPDEMIILISPPVI